VRHFWALIPLFCVAAATPGDPGRVTARRLTRTEYNYALHDLLGIRYPAAADFPQDDSGYGFDNIGDVLSLSPVLMEHYLNAAEKAARFVVFGPPPMRATVAKYQAVARPQPFQATPLMEADATGLSKPTAMHFRHNFPMEAEYAFLPTVGGDQTPGQELHFGLWIDGTQVAALDSETGRRAELRASIPAGEHTVSMSYMKPTRTGRINQVEIDGPFRSAARPGAVPADARAYLTSLAHRAFRRPVTAQEIDRFLALVALAEAQGDSYEEGLALAIQGILVSPHFLFRIEPDAKSKQARALTALELASRLSFFLWSSIPDDELLRAAESGLLRRPAMFEAQVRRMLRDPKADRLAESFAGQWLEIRRLESVKPDVARFPEFDDLVRYSLRRETELFFSGIVRDDRSVLEFLDAKYTYLNGRLGVFYGMPAVQGPEFRKVDLAGTPRTGVLGHGSVLTVSSYANRTSPVLRGKWILENLLNAPPPPPPPDVPLIDESKVGTAISMRQQMEQHRTNSACAGCHAPMDSLGFGLENFTAVGQWRSQDGAFPIDASGKVPDGREFRGPADLAATLAARPDAFARCLTEKLMTYALGRGLTSADKATVQQIAVRLAAKQYRFSALILEIVSSPQFQMRGADVRHA
jgi:hypothetical protein